MACLYKSIPSVSLVQAIHSVSWHHEGKQFMCSHSDGSLTLWNLRNTTKPFQVTFPHGETQCTFLLLFINAGSLGCYLTQQTEIEDTIIEVKALI